MFLPVYVFINSVLLTDLDCGGQPADRSFTDPRFHVPSWTRRPEPWQTNDSGNRRAFADGRTV